MWGYYRPPSRKASTSSNPSSPPYLSALVESPPPTNTPNPLELPSPRTPVHQALSRVDEDLQTVSGGSRAPLIARDFGAKVNGAYPIDNNRDTEEGSSSSLVNFGEPTFGSAPSLPQPDDRPTIDPRLVPPPSVHDAYLSKFIIPLSTSTDPPSTNERPSVIRSSSAPGVPQALLPSALPGTNRPDREQPTDGKPIFEIFNAELDTPAEEMVKVLKGHLEKVLKAQEEIGRVHFGLEGLDLTGEIPEEPGKSAEVENGLSKREKSVDEIMERLGDLSSQLRVYHHLGTPKLSFPQSTTSSTQPLRKTRTQSIDPSVIAATTSRSPLNRLGPPSANTTNTTTPRGKGNVPAFRSPDHQPPSRSPPNPRLFSPTAFPESIASSDRRRDLSSVDENRAANNQSDVGRDTPSGRGRGEEAWFEHTRRGLDEGHAQGGGHVESHLEMADRSRPW